MSLVRLRRRAAPLAVATLATFLFSMSPARFARADDEAAQWGSKAPASREAASETNASSASPSVPSENHAAASHAAGASGDHAVDATGTPQGGPARSVAPNFDPSLVNQVQSLPTGGDKTGVSSQAIALPQGSGKVQGMGESFSTQLSTGVANFTVPFALVPARGGAQPSLALSYSSASGHGVAGVGWDVGVPFIARQTDRGIPQYNDPGKGTAWNPGQDRFVFNGGQELIPICLVASGACSGALSGEVMPAWSDNWWYFRPRVEGSFLRFFWSPDHATWRVQSKSGTTMELGVPLDGSGYTGALETDPGNAAHIFRWNLAREYDAYGSGNPPAPVNIVAYRYSQDGSMAYLSDVYDTPPATNSGSAPLSAYSHHTRLVYEQRLDVTFSFRRGWQTTQAQRLVGVDVTSQTFGAQGLREMVRRYHLDYPTTFDFNGSPYKIHVSLLGSVQMEGQCAQPVSENQNGTLPSTSCPKLPAMTFDYQHVAPYDGTGQPSIPDLSGFEGFDERVHTFANSPNHSVDETLTDLFDINADGLPDVVVTAPFLYNGSHAVFFNGDGGKPGAFGNWQPMGVTGVSGEDTAVIALDNPNIAAHDIDGDALIDLLHMPLVKTYSVYTPTPPGNGGTWMWQGRQVTTASQQSPKIDFVNHNPAIKVVDVNADGLVDVVFSSGTEYQTFFSLGRFPPDKSGTLGDGQYGTAAWTSNSASTISNDPVESCLPWSATPALLSDPDVKLGDMNGDGLPDIVRLRPGDVRYWPGRGNGFWGTSGDPSSCPGGTFGQNQHIAMTSGPQFGVVASTESLLLDDVNGDGLDDLVKVRFLDVDVWLNIDGSSWTGRHTMSNTPPRSPVVDRMRLVDMNGSGTRDILYGDGYAYKYIDPNGGTRPWVLTHVENRLGKTTDIEYGTSTQFMLADAAAGAAWTSVAPMPIHVVTRVTERDHMDAVGRAPGVYVTDYSYRDAVYDGRQREFRGFRTARAKRIGDANSPTATTESTFLLGECKNDEKLAIDPCTVQGRWEDNPREALKGLPVLSETRDEAGNYLSTTHHTYRLRKLYAGLDGREVRYAFEDQSDTFLYDDAPFASNPQATFLSDVRLELTLGQVTTDTTSSPLVRASAGTAHLRRSAAVDPFGNAISAEDDGCISGCASTDEVIVTTTTPARRNDDPTGWMYRTVETYVTGNLTPGQRHHTFTSFDLGGNPTETDAALVGTLALDRFHEDASKVVAPPPPSASQDGTIVVSTQKYDAFGSLVHQAAPNDRCRDVTYDASYAELPVLETVYVGAAQNGCGQTGLSAIAQYDRGLHVVTQVTDLHGELTTAQYDGFGRLVSLYKPDPSNIGQVSGAAAVLIDYTLPSDPTLTPYSIVHTQTQDGPDAGTKSYREAFAYADGFGRAIVTLDQADPSAGDGGQWVVNGLTDYDAKGAARRAYLAWFWSGSGNQFPLSTKPPSPYGSQRYDAFGRQLQTFGLDGTITLQSAYHALSVDKWDAADILPGPHQGTPASARQDGHGRTVDVTERIHAGNIIESRDTVTTYLSTGEPAVITRVRGSDKVVRWIRYDSLGRMVLNVEPDTTQKFNPDPNTNPSTMKAWRYAYDDNGDLVGTSDARGCGANYLYDAGGRIVAEDFSPCLLSQQDYSSPDTTTGNGTEAYYVYDVQDSDTKNIPGFTIDPSLLLGRLTCVKDRGAETATRYDGRGRATGIARRIVKPGTPDDTLSARFAPHWYAQTVDFDGADRPVDASTGVDVTELLGQNNQSFVTTQYSKRGTVKSVGSSYGDLVTSVTRDADGLVGEIVYGDAAKTTSAMSYDNRRRLSSVTTYRGPPAIWSNPPPQYQPPPDPNGTPPTTFQLTLEDLDYHYDTVDNPTEIRDWRNPAEWPAGAQPVTRKIQYDDLYRVTNVAYSFAGGGDDKWVSPFYAEDNGVDSDPRRATPSPHVSFDKRVLSESFQYDWLGNTTRTDDDARGFYDRSLGAITNGTAGAGPYQLQGAQGATSTRDGSLTAAYDDPGNLRSMAVVRNGPCLPSGAMCSQRFVYDWDEVGRLARARRWDLASPGDAHDPVPQTTPTADLRHAYDASDNRTLKTAVVDPQGDEVHTAYVFGSLELRRASWNGTDYAHDYSTEVGYLFAHGVRLARLHYALDSEPTLSSGKLHVLFEMPDHLGSTSIVMDRETSELVEAPTYQPYGGTESDYRPGRWASFREDYGFTGKEGDAETGIQYFGKRYLAPLLGRWTSGDPLTTHRRGADPNLYAYVHGDLIRAVDPVGLQEAPGADARSNWTAARGLYPNDPQKQQEHIDALHQAEGTGALTSFALLPCLSGPEGCIVSAWLLGGSSGVEVALFLGGLLGTAPEGRATARTVARDDVAPAGPKPPPATEAKPPVAQALETSPPAPAGQHAQVAPPPTPPAPPAPAKAIAGPQTPPLGSPSPPSPQAVTTAAVQATANQIGAMGEQAARAWLQGQGYTDIVTLQNASGHGIDIAARDAQGAWRFFEVKTSTGARAPALRGDQRLGARAFVESRLERAAAGEGPWAGNRAVQQKADRILTEMEASGQQISGDVISVTSVGTPQQTISTQPWVAK